MAIIYEFGRFRHTMTLGDVVPVKLMHTSALILWHNRLLAGSNVFEKQLCQMQLMLIYLIHDIYFRSAFINVK
jgi:hypothetical protein